MILLIYSVNLNKLDFDRVAGSSWPASFSDLPGEIDISKNSKLRKLFQKDC